MHFAFYLLLPPSKAGKLYFFFLILFLIIYLLKFVCHWISEPFQLWKWWKWEWNGKWGLKLPLNPRVRGGKGVWLAWKKACSLHHTVNCALSVLSWQHPFPFHILIPAAALNSVFLLTCLFSQASFKNVLFFLIFFLQKIHTVWLLTLHHLPSFSKVVYGKGKQETVFQTDKLALSCKQPVVRTWSGSPAGQ